MNYENRIKKINFAIKTLKEMALNTKHQKIEWGIKNSPIIIGLVSNEVEVIR